MKIKNERQFRSKFFLTILFAIILCFAFLMVITYSYQDAENSAFENLHMRTREIKEDINLQMISDRENLQTIANMAGTLYQEGKDYDILFNSFESIGLIKNIGILTPDNSFTTKNGVINLNGKMDFTKEVAKSPYFSGKVEDVTHPTHQVIRSSVPIKVQNETVGVLYGIIELNNIKKKYKPIADGIDARLYVIESGNGNFIVDTWSHDLGNLADSKPLKDKKGYSYDAMKEDIYNGGSGFCAYQSTISRVFMYSHYSPIGISDWEIVLSVPESNVLESAVASRRHLFTIFIAVVCIMSLYTLIIFYLERKQAKLTRCASTIRKSLLGINQKKSNLTDALKKFTNFTGAAITFFANVDGDYYSYCAPGISVENIEISDRDRIITRIFEIASKYHLDSNITLLVSDIRRKDAEKYDFVDVMEKYGIKHISFASIYDNDNHINVLVSINPVRKYAAKEILKDVAVCFSISIHNKNYLNKTESEAVTDALTGVYNRVAYKKYVEKINSVVLENFACVYVDVNELHSYNNKYGHVAGDEMLLCIANILKEVFFGHNIYRMGGDEYLVFVEDTTKEAMNEAVESLVEKTEKSGYHISVGMNFAVKNMDTDRLVREAEERMYDAKAKYYQSKEKHSVAAAGKRDFKFIETGMVDLDMMLKVLSGHYSGIFFVSLSDDTARRIIMPSYMDFGETDSKFSRVFTDYVNENVHHDFHRGMLKFLNYSVLKAQLDGGESLRYTYKKNNGEGVVLSIYAQGDNSLWVFENA